MYVGAKALYWVCTNCGSIELVAVEEEGDQGYVEGDEEPCVDCETGTSRVKFLSPKEPS
jgi:hypothetical protein